MRTANQEVLSGLRSSSLSSIEDILGQSKDVALLDFPGHMNVGDSMIWAGELAYLGQLNVKVRYACDIERFSAAALRKVHPNGPILLHGGGNLGDVWPRFQAFREMVVQEFPDRKIVQLPQTLFFDSVDAAAQADAILGAHPDFTLLLRDHNSMKRAIDLLPSVRTRFVPDMALGWTPNSEGEAVDRGVLILGRQDHESSSDMAGLATGLSDRAPVQTADWGLEGLALKKWKAVRIPGSLARRSRLLRDSSLSLGTIHRAYASMLDMNLAAGVDLFRGRRLIVTDRLHAHVLAALLDIPHVVLDNSYGKIRSIHDDYTGAFETVHFAENERHALELCQAILDGPNQRQSDAAYSQKVKEEPRG